MSKDVEPLEGINLERAICLLANTAYRTLSRIPDHKFISLKAWKAICAGLDINELCQKHDEWYRGIIHRIIDPPSTERE